MATSTPSASSGGAHQLAGAAAGDVAALTDGSVHADGAGVGQAQLDLGCAAGGAQNGHVLQRTLGANDGAALHAGVLTGLAQLLAGSQLMTCAEESLHVLLAQMDVTGRSFNRDDHG